MWALFAFCAMARADNAILECTADTWIARTNSGVHGRDAVLELGGEKLILLQFRMSAIEGWKVQKAVLLLHISSHNSSNFRPRATLLAAIASPWKESAATPPALGKTVQADERIKPDGWIVIEVPPGLAQSLVDAKTFGLAIRLSDDEAQKFDTRETVHFSPFLVVQGIEKK